MPPQWRLTGITQLLLYFVHIGLAVHAMDVVSGSSQLKLIQDMLETYDRKAKPTWDNNHAVNVTFSLDLYQILELNEPQQYVLLNAWVIERWNDEFLYWNPEDYGDIKELRLPYYSIWLPDTTLYNSLVMKDEDTRRLLNAKLTTNTTRKAALVEMLYPTIYKFSCLLSLRFFPYDLQKCSMIFSSWTYDQKGIDYFPYSDTIGTSNFLENEGWALLKTDVERREVKYSCCPTPYTMLKLTLYLRRKPLFYVINLIIPTSIITLIAIVGFFSTSAASGMREEKVSLGITTLLSMSILMLMVSDQMPTTSTFIPLIGWFILSMIIVISIGTLASSFVIAVQKRGRLGERLSAKAVKAARLFASLSLTDVPLHLRQEQDKSEDAKLAGKKPLRKEEQRSLFGRLFHRNRATRLPLHTMKNGRGRGVAARHIPTDKSTEPLVLSISNSNMADTPSGMMVFANGGGGTAMTPVASPLSPLNLDSLPPPPTMIPQQAEVHTGSDGDDGSGTGRVTPISGPTPGRVAPAAASRLAAFPTRASQVLQHFGVSMNGSIGFFIVFVTTFIILTGGINLIGYWHWSKDVGSVIYENPETIVD